MKKNLKPGDVLAIKIDATENYYFGRVLFNPKMQYKNQEGVKNYLDWHQDSLLIETYKHISDVKTIMDFDVAIKSVFIPTKKLLKEDLSVIGNIPVDVTSVTFPETLKNFERICYFTVGELAIETSLSTEYAYDNVKVFPTMGNIYYLQIATLDNAGRKDLIANKADIMDNYFRFSDLRSIPELRIEIYDSINEDPNENYYNLALRHGFDLKRWYE